MAASSRKPRYGQTDTGPGRPDQRRLSYDERTTSIAPDNQRLERVATLEREKRDLVAEVERANAEADELKQGDGPRTRRSRVASRPQLRSAVGSNRVRYKPRMDTDSTASSVASGMSGLQVPTVARRQRRGAPARRRVAHSTSEPEQLRRESVQLRKELADRASRLKEVDDELATVS